MRGEGTFIAVEVDDDAAADTGLATALADACPVDIFAASDGRLSIVEKNVDECVLCRLCLDAVAARDPIPVRVIKRYDGDALLS